jgi:hypothetical protein
MAPEYDRGPEIGRTGARFGGGSRRRSRRADDTVTDPVPDPVTETLPVVPAPSTSDAVGLTGARFGGAARRRRRAEPDPVVPEDADGPAEHPAAELPAAEPPTPPPADAAPEPEVPAEAEVSSASVRPYVLTRGRTRSKFELAVETLVSAVPMAVGDPGPHVMPTTAAILALCREPRSVAEVAAMLGLPLGVARVLLGDLAASGALAVHASPGTAGPDLALLERVLGGLRRL